MKVHTRRTRPAFTLVELITVIAIIALLAGLVVAGTGFAKQRQASEKAKVQIALLSKAIEEFKADMGFYPGDLDNTPVDGNVSKELYQALFYEGYEYQDQGKDNDDDWKNPNGTPKATRIYLPELDPRNSKLGWVTRTTSDTPGDNLDILDPWGSGYRYRKGSDAQNPDFDVWSIGKDGKTNATNPDTTLDENRDDIRNF